MPFIKEDAAEFAAQVKDLIRQHFGDNAKAVVSVKTGESEEGPEPVEGPEDHPMGGIKHAIKTALLKKLNGGETEPIEADPSLADKTVIADKNTGG